jgi:hypothetical protein
VNGVVLIGGHPLERRSVWQEQALVSPGKPF